MKAYLEIEMPKSCYYCPMANDGFYLCKATSPFKELEDDCEERRPDWCPLIPVPPHGDLIDRDAAVEKIWDDMRFPSNLANAQFFVNELREMPTIIPADGKDIKVPTREECE